MSEWEYKERVCGGCQQQFMGERPLCHTCERKNTQYFLLGEIDEAFDLMGLKIAELLTGNEMVNGEQEIHRISLKLFETLEKKYKTLYKYLQRVCDL